MAQSDHILNRLCDLQQTNFEVVDVQVKDEEIIWRIKHKGEAFYICSRCGEKCLSAHDKEWIELDDIPFGNKRSVWKVRRAPAATQNQPVMATPKPATQKCDFIA